MRLKWKLIWSDAVLLTQPEPQEPAGEVVRKLCADNGEVVLKLKGLAKLYVIPGAFPT